MTSAWNLKITSQKILLWFSFPFSQRTRGNMLKLNQFVWEYTFTEPELKSKLFVPQCSRNSSWKEMSSSWISSGQGQSSPALKFNRMLICWKPTNKAIRLEELRLGEENTKICFGKHKREEKGGKKIHLSNKLAKEWINETWHSRAQRKDKRDQNIIILSHTQQQSSLLQRALTWVFQIVSHQV